MYNPRKDIFYFSLQNLWFLADLNFRSEEHDITDPRCLENPLKKIGRNILKRFRTSLKM